MSGHVFISYRHGSDGAYVEKLAAYLIAVGIPVWFDLEVVTGDRWANVIEEKINTCAAFVVIMTPAAKASSWVSREITQAEHVRRPILPLLLKGQRFFTLAHLQFEDVSGGRMPTPRFVGGLRDLTAPSQSSSISGDHASQALDAVRPGGTPANSAPWPLIFTGHDETVVSMAWSPDGRCLTTGSIDRTARIWNPATGETLHILMGHTGCVTSVSWSPGGRYLATGSTDGTARIWNPDKGKALRTLSGRTGLLGGIGFVASVVWSPDGRHVATTGSADKTARIWKPVKGRLVCILSGHAGGVASVSWSPDGRYLAIGSTDGTARIWNPTTGTTLHTLSGHTSTIGSFALAPVVVWSPNGRHLATGSTDMVTRIWRMRIWNPTTGTTLHTLTVQTGPGGMGPVAWSPDGHHLATSGDQTMRIWAIPLQP